MRFLAQWFAVTQGQVVDDLRICGTFSAYLPWMVTKPPAQGTTSRWEGTPRNSHCCEATGLNFSWRRES
jgi:hypothetical protein